MLDDRDRPGRDRGSARPAAGPGETANDHDGLAPVIPLFGGARSAGPASGSDVAGTRPSSEPSTVDPLPISGRASTDVGESPDAAVSGGTDAEWHPTWRDEPKGRAAHPSTGTLRTVGPASGLLPSRRSAHREDDATAAPIAMFPRSGGVGARTEDSDDRARSTSDARERAEAVLLRKLRSRSLSLSEARTALRGVEGVDDTIVDELIDHFVDLGYLDDAMLAEQLVLTATERRGDGRRVVVQTLTKRGIPRDVAEAAVSELPDDDDERALDLARSKIRGVEGHEYDTALRRLVGQLSRRGYSSSVALRAARSALDEAGIGRGRGRRPPASGVRFTPDD